MKAPSEQEMARVESLLFTRFGLDGEALGDGSLQQALRQRMVQGGIDDGDVYVRQLLVDEDELYEFVEHLLVPETWFFRDERSFACLRRFMSESWQPHGCGERLRVLSAACSTGEEAYSIAMTLLDLGLRPEQFHVDGVDLSRRALAKAAEGVYHKSSIRGDRHEFSGLLDSYLLRQGRRLEVAEAVRASIRFQQANLAAANFLRHEPAYQVIFCRNVLIYFQANARRTMFAHLHRLLDPGGLLCVGGVEAAVVAEGPFRSLEEFPFAFHPEDDGATGPEDTPPQTPSRARRRVRGRPLSPQSRQRPLTLTAVEKPSISARAKYREAAAVAEKRASPPESENDPLRLAREAADGGRLDEAAALCRQVLAESPAGESGSPGRDADALCLLGLVCQTRGEIPEADEYFHKALYLVPRHHEALVHLMLLAQRRGDQPAAGNYRRRAERASRAGG